MPLCIFVYQKNFESDEPRLVSVADMSLRDKIDEAISVRNKGLADAGMQKRFYYETKTPVKVFTNESDIDLGAL